MGNKFHSANRSNSSRRRNIMKTVASAIGVSTLIPAVSTGQASTTDEQHKYRGITYEPVTLTQQGQARAEVREVDEELSGELRIPGFKIPLEDDQGGLTLDSKRDQFNKYTVTKSEKKFTKDDSSLNVTLFVSDHVIVGRLTRDSVEYGPLSFTLGATKHGFSVEHAQSGLDSIQKSPVGADSITVPDKGLPKSNSMAAVQAREGKNKSTDGGTYDVGFLQDTDYDGSIEYEIPSYCGSDSGDVLESTWGVGLGTSCRKKGDYPWDAIERTNYKFINIVSHFTEVPDNVTPPEYASSGEPTPTLVEFQSQHVDSENKGRFSYEDYYPNGEDDPNSGPADGVMDLALDLIGGANAYLGALTAVIDYVLDADSGSDLYANKGTNGEQGEIVQWNLPIGSSFPSSSDNTAGVEVKLSNSEVSEGDSGYFQASCRWSFLIDGYPEGGCPDGYSHLVYETSTERYTQYCSFDGA